MFEPQAWETHGKARKMGEKLRTNAESLNRGGTSRFLEIHSMQRILCCYITRSLVCPFETFAGIERVTACC